MLDLFPPPLGARIASRFDLVAPLRGEGAVRTFLVHDQQTGQRRSLSLFDPAHTQIGAWAEFARLVAVAAEAGVPGLKLPPQVPPTPSDPPHLIDDLPVHRGLDRLLAQDGRIPWQRALAIGERIAGILQSTVAVTRVGHRALTPSRCTVDTRDEAELLDYGVAEIELNGEPSDDAEYRAPEQRGAKGDHRSDVYSLAAILYELISGECPAGTAPAPLSSLSTAPPAVAALLDQALAKDPALRPADPAAMRATLRQLLGLAALPASTTQAPVEPRPAAPPSPTNKLPGELSSLARPDPKPLLPLGTSSPSALTPRPASRQPILPEPLPAPRPTPRPQMAPIEPPERTERLPQRQPSPDATLILPNTADPPTERLSKPPAAVPVILPSSTRSNPGHLDDPPTDRTEVLSPLPARAPSPLPDRTEVLSPHPPHAAPLPERTEVLSATPAHAPRYIAAAQVTLPNPATDIDEDKTTVMPAHRRVPVQSTPASTSQVEPTVAIIVPGRPAHPAIQAPAHQVPPTMPSLLSPHVHITGRTLRTALIAFNVALGLAILVRLLLWAI